MTVSALKVGDHVHADFGSGSVIAHVAKLAHKNAAGETKYGIQDPNGVVAQLAYREPEDDDAAGSGMTFWLI